MVKGKAIIRTSGSPLVHANNIAAHCYLLELLAQGKCTGSGDILHYQFGPSEVKCSVPGDLLGDYYEKSPKLDVFSPVDVRILTSEH